MIGALRSWFVRRPMVGDALMAALIFWPVLGSLTRLHDSDPEWPYVVWSLAYVVPLVIRRTHPQWAALALFPAHLVQLALTDVPFFANVTVPIALHSVATRTEPRRARLWLLVAALASVAAGADWGMSRATARVTTSIANGLVAFVVCAAAWFMGRLGAERRRSEIALRRRAAVDERTRIAREMHDVVAHSLSVIVVQADGGAYLARLNGQDATTLETVATTARTALAETRRLVGVLRDGSAGPVDWEPGASLEGVHALVAATREAGLRVTYAEHGDPLAHPPLGAGAQLAAYRIVQEALTNVLRHAGPEASAEVTLTHRPDGVRLAVLNTGRRAGSTLDGSGRSGAPGHGHGLIGMRERVAAYDGKLVAGPRPDGFEVIATLPTEESRP